MLQFLPFSVRILGNKTMQRRKTSKKDARGKFHVRLFILDMIVSSLCAGRSRAWNPCSNPHVRYRR